MSLKTHKSEIYKIRHCNIADQELLLRFSGAAEAAGPRAARRQDAGRSRGDGRSSRASPPVQTVSWHVSGVPCTQEEIYICLEEYIYLGS